MPKNGDEGNISTLQVWNLMFRQCKEPICVAQHSRNVISALGDDTLEIPFMFCIVSYTGTHLMLWWAFSVFQKRMCAFIVPS